MLDYRVLPAGDTALVVEFGERIDRQLSAYVLALARRLNGLALDGLVETVPTFRSLLVHYEPLRLSAASLTARIGELMRDLEITEKAGRLWRLPVCYDTAFAPDLEAVAARCALSPAQVIERHSAVTYHVYMLGFLPGQAYMGDVATELALPRRATPRASIPAGSVAIAMNMTCIFPQETPCGWHVIGRSPVALWQTQGDRGALLAPGDKVIFAPVSAQEYARLVARASAGMRDIFPHETTVGTG